MSKEKLARRENLEMEFQARRDWFAYVSNDALSRRKHVVDLASMTLRTLSLANGGALVALLTFLGHNWSVALAQQLMLAGVIFSLGLFFVVVGMCCAILWQGKGADHAYPATHRTFLDLMAVAKPQDADRLMRIAEDSESREGAERASSDRWLGAAILATILSTLTFIGGAFAAMGQLT